MSLSLHRERDRLLFRLALGEERFIYQRLEAFSWELPIRYLSPTFQTRQGHLESAYKYIQDFDSFVPPVNLVAQDNRT